MSPANEPGAPAAGFVAPPVVAAKDALTDSTNASFVITAYAHALQNVTLEKLVGQGDWFAAFEADLTAAQQHAQYWVGELGPSVFATVPQAIIDYSNVFIPATDDILSILAAIHGVPTPAQQKQIDELLGALLQTLRAKQTTLTQLQGELKVFFADIAQDCINLLAGQHSVQQQVLADQGLVADINARITAINGQIASDSARAMASEIGLGIAIFITVVAIGFAIATEGAALPLVAVGVGLLGVGGAIATTTIFSKAVDGDIDELHAQQQALTDEQRQVSALQAISDTLGLLVQANEAAQQAMATVLDAWAVLETKLKAVIEDIEEAEAPEIAAYIEALDLRSAQAAWQQLVEFATGMQKSARSISVQTARHEPQRQTV